MLQQERTVLAWERTAIATIIAGLLFVRSASEWHPLFTLIGFCQVIVGAGILVWAGYHYNELNGAVSAGRTPIRPDAARVVGVAAMLFTGAATISAAVAEFAISS